MTIREKKHMMYYGGNISMGKLMIEGNSVYEIDDACIRRKKEQLENVKEFLSHEDKNEWMLNSLYTKKQETE